MINNIIIWERKRISHVLEGICVKSYPIPSLCLIDLLYIWYPYLAIMHIMSQLISSLKLLFTFPSIIAYILSVLNKSCSPSPLDDLFMAVNYLCLRSFNEGQLYIRCLASSISCKSHSMQAFVDPNSLHNH